MSTLRQLSLLCASLAFAAPAWAEVAPFVTQLRLPTRNATLDVFAWRSGDEVIVARADLERLAIVPPSREERISLNAVPGLSYSIDEASSAVALVCTSACFATQRVGVTSAAPNTIQATSARGAYLNYDVEARWLETGGLSGSGIAEAAAFGPWGLVESSWLGGDAAGVTRLETRWTIDRPQHRIRMRVGDSTAISAGGAAVRFGGLQIGRHFGLDPSLITYPTAALTGEATNASTVELYVDGVLRARDRVEAGPFALEDAPLVSGAGEAQLVVTDVAGRQQIITRPFFVSMALLRPGLSDWAVSAGATREGYGRRSASYGERFASARYRRGLTQFLTAETAIDVTERGSILQAGATAAHVSFGQVHMAHAFSDDGGATSLSWFQQSGAWSFGAQGETRDAGFGALGQETSSLRNSVAANVSANFGDAGSASLSGASIRRAGESELRTLSLAYAPRFDFGALSIRLTHTQDEESDIALSLGFSLALSGDVSTSFGYDLDGRGATYRANSQRVPGPANGFGWRARSTGGAYERLEFSGMRRGDLGDSTLQIARTRSGAGVRAQHSGSIGVIEDYAFAARPIRGAFALVDAGAPNVSVSRDRLRVGATNQSGRALATGLRAYDANTIGIAAEDLPFDRALASAHAIVAPAEGAGVVVRFEQAAEHLQEIRIAFPDGTAPARGALLVRERDGARFPVGSDGRIVLFGSEEGDLLRLADDARCTARTSQVAMNGLELTCEAA